MSGLPEALLWRRNAADKGRIAPMAAGEPGPVAASVSPELHGCGGVTTDRRLDDRFADSQFFPV
jgi:hypothetical protein